MLAPAPSSPSTTAEPKKRGRKKNETLYFILNGVKYRRESAKEKFTLLLEASELESIETAFRVFTTVAQKDLVLAEYVRDQKEGDWKTVTNRNQMIKHAIRLYFRTLGIDFDQKKPFVEPDPTPAAYTPSFPLTHSPD